MAKRAHIKDLEIKAFAQEYVKNGMNATRAMLAIKPQLTEGSAGVVGSRMLDDVKTVGAISSLYDSVKDDCTRALRKAIAQAEQWLDSDNPQLQLHAHKVLIEYGKIFAPANSVPRTATQINKYTFPKR